MLTGCCSHFICGFQILRYSAYCCWRPWATCNHMHIPSTAKYIYSEPILLSCTITIVCNSLFLPMGLFPFISVLFPQLQQTREGYKDDTMAKSLGSLQMGFLHHQIISALSTSSISLTDHVGICTSWRAATYRHFSCVSELLLPYSFSPQNVYDCK